MKNLLRCLALLVALGWQAALAQTWPTKPIEIIVGFPPGGGTDLSARTIARTLEKYIEGAKVVVVNKPGASGEIALEFVRRANPDGYTLGTTNMPGFVTVPIERGNQARYTYEDFTLLGNQVFDPVTLTVPLGSPYKTLRELIDQAKSNPGVVSLGSTGIGTVAHILSLQMAQATGAKMMHVPFQGSAPLRTSVMGGHIPVAGLNAGEFSGVQDRVRILAVARAERSPILPNVPTIKEAIGLEMVAASERGIVAPKGLPEAIRAKIDAALVKVGQDPEFIAATQAQGNEVFSLDGAQWRARLTKQNQEMLQLWKRTPWSE